MRYTVTSGGVTIGETDLGFVRSAVGIRVGWFHPNADGERLLPRLLPPLALRAHLDREAWAGDRAASAHHCEASPLALHREDGSVVPTRSLGIQDMHALLAAAELEEARRETLPWSPEHEQDADVDDEPLAIHLGDDLDDEALLGGEPAPPDGEWAPDDEPVEHPRYQIVVALVDDGAIP